MYKRWKSDKTREKSKWMHHFVEHERKREFKIIKIQ